MMRISHKGSNVLVGDVQLGCGSALVLASLIQSKLSDPQSGSIIKVDLRGGILKMGRLQATQAIKAIRKHAALAQVCRGPIGSGPIRGKRDAVDRVDDIWGRLAQMVDGARDDKRR